MEAWTSLFHAWRRDNGHLMLADWTRNLELDVPFVCMVGSGKYIELA
jgi:hypothetical protein